MAERAPIDVVAALSELGARLDPGDQRDLVGPALVRLAADPHRRPNRAPGASWRRTPRWVVLASAAALLAVVIAVAVPDSRAAIGRLLGIGGVQVHLTGDVPDATGGQLRLGRRVTVDEAADLAAGGLEVPAALPDPAAAYAGLPPGGVTLVWAPSDNLPEAANTGVGALLSSFPGATSRPRIDKFLGLGTELETTTVEGEPAFWIAGAFHEFSYVDAEGRQEIDTVRLAANTLLWTVDGITYRLESALDRDRAVEVAESLRRVEG